MKWTRFSVRRGAAKDVGPLEGVPDHLRAELYTFIHEVKQNHRDQEAGTLQRTCRRLHIPVSKQGAAAAVLAASSDDNTGDTLLDAVDCILHISSEAPRYVGNLNLMFEDCGVNWLAEEAYWGSKDEFVPPKLTYRLEPEVREAMRHALDPSDQASTRTTRSVAGRVWP